MLLHILHFQLMCRVIPSHALHVHPLVTIVERKDIFVPIARSCKVYPTPSNVRRIFLHPRRLQFRLENLNCQRSLLTVCWKLKLHKCGWPIIKSPDQGGRAPTPSADTKIHSRGVATEGELLHPDWQKLHDDICLSIMDKYRGGRMKSRGGLQAKTIQDLKSSNKGNLRSTMLIFLFKIQCIFCFSFQ